MLGGPRCIRLWRSESVFIAGLLQSVMFEVGWCELWGEGLAEETPFYTVLS